MLQGTYEDAQDFLATAWTIYGDRAGLFLETDQLDARLGLDLPIRLVFRSPERSFVVHGRVIWRRAKEGTRRGKRLPPGLAMEFVGGYQDDAAVLFEFLAVEPPKLPAPMIPPSVRTQRSERVEQDAGTIKIAFDFVEDALDLYTEVDGRPAFFVPTRSSVPDRFRLILMFKQPRRTFAVNAIVQSRAFHDSARMPGATVTLEDGDPAFPEGREALLEFLSHYRPRGVPA